MKAKWLHSRKSKQRMKWMFGPMAFEKGVVLNYEQIILHTYFVPKSIMNRLWTSPLRFCQRLMDKL